MYDSVFHFYPENRYLLLDEAIVSAAERCPLVFFAAVKDPSNPVISKTLPWEGNGVSAWNGSILLDPDTGRYRFYYSTFEDDRGPGRPSLYLGGIAESVDGLSWKKPETFPFRFRGVPTACGCWLDDEAETALDPSGPRSFDAVYDPRPECPPEERYKALGLRRQGGGICVFCSGDGIRWRKRSPDPVWWACSDIIHPFWDEKKGRFVCYFKLWKLFAQVPDDTAPGGFRPASFLSWGGFSPEKREDGLTAVTGDWIDLHPESRASVERRTILVRSGDLGADDGGGANLTGAYYFRRVVHYAESADFLHWEHEQEVLDTDERDRPSANIQLAQVFPMGGYYLAFLNVHDERGHFEQQLAFSADGIRFRRPWRGNLLGVGAPGQFDAGMAAGMQPPVLTESQMLLYYGGYAGGHADTSPGKIAIGRAVMRREGFAARRVRGDEAGYLETVLLPVTAGSLAVNADCESGELEAELCGEDGAPIPGYTFTDCDPVRADSASFPDCLVPVSWRGCARLPASDALRVRLHFRNADVFAVRI